ncbi:MAG: SelL-related redox protein [Saprospiraceae bacterium]
MMLLKSIGKEYFEEMYTNEGANLLEVSSQKPVMLIFLRHFGCTFCRESLADLAEQRAGIEETGMQIIFVHMAENPVAEDYFKKYKLEGVAHISDTACRYYRTFGLGKGSFSQLYGLRTWMRGFEAGVVKGHGGPELNPTLGDSTQMPGIFVIRNGEIIDSYIHKVASARPDYLKLARCCVIP